ncbi:hypothetical protein CV770_15635 [Bradyrhizobium sp. AC87j1]|nr:hypothetical protein CV770_15635 [Bradyrhizobium sp. AC87j1]
MLPRVGNRAGHCPDEGCGVSAVASREMAAGLQALSAMSVLARKPAPSLSMDQSQRAGRLLSDRFDHGQRRSAAMLAGTAVSRQKPTEIRFRGAVASCYPPYSMGAEGVVTNTSRRPN